MWCSICTHQRFNQCSFASSQSDTAITNKSTFFEQCLSHTSYTIITTRSNKTVTTKKEFLKKGHTFKILVFPWYILNISSPQEICWANLECLFWNVSFVANKYVTNCNMLSPSWPYACLRLLRGVFLFLFSRFQFWHAEERSHLYNFTSDLLKGEKRKGDRPPNDLLELGNRLDWFFHAGAPLLALISVCCVFLDDFLVLELQYSALQK